MVEERKKGRFCIKKTKNIIWKGFVCFFAERTAGGGEES